MYRPDLHMLLSLLKEKLSREKLSITCRPHWLLMIELCHVQEKFSTAFSGSTLTPSFFPLRCYGICLLSAWGDDPDREGSQRGTKSPFPFSHKGASHVVLTGYDGGGKKPRLDQEQRLLSTRASSHKPIGLQWARKHPLFTCFHSAKGNVEVLKQLTKSFEATLFSSLILDQTQQLLTSSFRCKFF